MMILKLIDLIHERCEGGYVKANERDLLVLGILAKAQGISGVHKAIAARNQEAICDAITQYIRRNGYDESYVILNSVIDWFPVKGGY